MQIAHSERFRSSDWPEYLNTLLFTRRAHISKVVFSCTHIHNTGKICHCLLSTGSTGSLHLLVEEHITYCTCSNQCHKIECHNNTNDNFDKSSKSEGKVVSKLYEAHDETHPPAAMVATWLGSANGLRSRPAEYYLQRKRRFTANDPSRQYSRCRIAAVLKFRTSHTTEFLSVGLNLK